MLPDKATAEPIERTEANARRAQPAAAASDLPLTVIEPSRGWIAINWKDLWQYRELLYFLTWLDVKVR